MNVDENPGAVEPFMAQNKYAFPALLAYKYVRDTLQLRGTPTNWIIDGDGVARFEEIGYDSSLGQKWEDGMSAEIEKNRQATAQAARSPGK